MSPEDFADVCAEIDSLACGCCEINDYCDSASKDFGPCLNCGHSPEEHAL